MVVALRDFYSARETKGTGKKFFYYPLGFPEYYTVPDDSIPIKEKRRIWWNCRSCVYLDGRNRRWLCQRKICWRWSVYLWCDSKTCRSCKRKLNMFFWKVMARTMAFLLPRHPHIVNYLHSPHSFSVHLLNCYFPDFPACHIAEKFMKCSCFLNPANTTDERVNFHSTM